MMFLFITSCNKEESWEDKRNQILGKWKAEVDISILTDSNIEVKDEASYFFNFMSISVVNVEKIVKSVDESTFELNFDWFYQPTPEHVILNYRYNSQTKYTFKVIENTPNQQLWEADYFDVIYENGEYQEVRFIETWKLTKI